MDNDNGTKGSKRGKAGFYAPAEYVHPKNITLRALPAHITNVPKPYEPDAFKLLHECLDECLTLTDAQWCLQWDEAASAWAKMAGSKEVLDKAKRFRIYCWKKVGALLLANKEPQQIGAGHVANPAGRRALASAHGINPTDMRTAIGIARIPPEKMPFFLDRKTIPTPHSLLVLSGGVRTLAPGESRRRASDSDSYRNFRLSFHLSSVRSYVRKNTPKSVIRGMRKDEVIRVKNEADLLGAWIRELSVAAGRALNK